MKKLFTLLTIAMVIASCNKETAVLEQENTKMLESYIIKRNANGSYTLNHQVSEGVVTQYVDGDKINEVQLYYSAYAQHTNYSHDYNVTNNELQIKFLSQDNVKHSKIRIIDDNTADVQGKESLGLLKDYTIVENANGTYQLSFEVEQGVSINFDYDATQKLNNVYLTPDTQSVQTTFSVNYSKENDGTLKIDFVQPITEKGESNDMRKPRILMDDSDAISQD